MTQAENLLREARKRLDHHISCPTYSTGGTCNCGVTVLLARIDACLSAAPSGWVSIPAKTLLAVRDMISLKDCDEAYHLLYNAVPWQDPYKPWAEWELLAAAGEGK